MSGKTRSGVGAVFMAVGSLVTGGAAAYAWVWMAAGAALSYSGAKKQQSEALRRSRAARNLEAVKGIVRGSHEHHLMVFGKTRVGGILAAIGTENGPDMPHQFYYYAIIHSISHAGGCKGITAIYIDDTRIPLSEMDANPNGAEANVNAGPYAGLLKVRHYLGTATQAADADLINFAGEDANSWRRGCAYTKVRMKKPADGAAFERAYKFGFPNITVEMEGILCYDPRQDSTNGGTGTQRVATPTTWAWSDNPILCAATYSIVRSLDGGEGIPTSRILWDTVASAASICDENVVTPAGNRKRFTCNGALLTNDDVQVNLQKILDSCAGKRVPVGGQFAFYAGAWRAETFTIDSTWLAGDVEIQAGAPNEASYNSVRVNFSDAESDYKTIEAVPFVNESYEIADGGPLGARRITRDLTLPMVSDKYQAQSLASIEGRSSRNQKIITLPCNMKAWDLQLEETGSVNLPGADLSGLRWRVDHWEPTELGVNLALRQDAATVYDVPTFVVPAAAGVVSPGVETPAAPTGLSVVAVADGLQLRWTPPAYYSYETIEIQRSASSGGTYAFAGAAAAGTTTFTDPITDGGTWFYRVRAMTLIGTPGAFAGPVSATARQPASAGSVAADNPGFEDGNTRWTAEAGWQIENTPGQAR